MGAWWWLLAALGGWVAIAVAVAVVLARVFGAVCEFDAERRVSAKAPGQAPGVAADPRVSRNAPEPARRLHAGRRRVLTVDDDALFRSLVTTTLSGNEFELVEAGTIAEARMLVGEWEPDVVLLDVGLPDGSGLELCAELAERGRQRPLIVVLTGADSAVLDPRASLADAVLTKPFSPLDLVGLLDGLADADQGVMRGSKTTSGEEQLLLYARDLSRVIDVERAQRRLLENAYRQTVTALAAALEARDTGTRLHSLRVTRYALEITAHVDAQLLADPSLIYGFALHDIGKIGIPDRILLKEGRLDPFERKIVQRHPEIGSTILADVALLHREGLGVVRSHHERWDGTGYPDQLAGAAIPVGARIFAVADTLDAITSDRPYRPAAPWDEAVEEIVAEADSQFDPDIVDAFVASEPALQRIFAELSVAA